MALNITFDGFCSLDNLSLSGATVKYQGLFANNGTASSSNTWNSVRTVEASSYYNINLGSADWLSQTGTVLNGSKVLIVFWESPVPITDNRNALCSILDQWGAFEIDIDGSDTYTNAIQVKANICPDLSWTLPTTGFVNTNYSTTNSSEDLHSWLFGSVLMEHIRTRYGEDIQLINTVDNTDYFWDDSQQDLNLPGVATGTHQWANPGIYSVDIVIEDECTCTVTGTKDIKIYYHAPLCGIKCNGDLNTPDSVVTFEYDGVDVDSTIFLIDWHIHDSGVYGTTDTISSGIASDVIAHTNGLGTDWCSDLGSTGAFTNPGSHLVEATIHWGDGFDNHVLNCSETFVQQKFSGPVVNFYQDPTQVTLYSGVKFVNSSTNTSRVGLGLPDCYNYTWSWNDDGNIDYEVDKLFSFALERTTNTEYCTVKLCADYSDGWDTLTTCTEKTVVFKTTITITPEDCYYDLDIIGTSSDGSVSGYSWNINKYTTYSGTGPPTGPIELVWQSPEGMDQKDKKVCFTEEGWYNVVGYVYGTGATTSDDENQEINIVCAADCYVYIWNGTGVLDLGGDWQHSEHGFEADYAKNSGTNGLDASNMVSGSIIKFSSGYALDVTGFDLLRLWINIRAWQGNKHINVEFYNNGVLQGNSVRLDYYLNKASLNEWQKVFVSLSACGVETSSIDEVRLVSEGNISIYLDDIIFEVGSVVYSHVPGHKPEVEAQALGALHVASTEDKAQKIIVSTTEDRSNIPVIPRPSDEITPVMTARKYRSNI